MTIPVMSSRFFMCPSSADAAPSSVRPAPVSTRACMWIERTHRYVHLMRQTSQALGLLGQGLARRSMPTCPILTVLPDRETMAFVVAYAVTPQFSGYAIGGRNTFTARARRSNSAVLEWTNGPWLQSMTVQTCASFGSPVTRTRIARRLVRCFAAAATAPLPMSPPLPMMRQGVDAGDDSAPEEAVTTSADELTAAAALTITQSTMRSTLTRRQEGAITSLRSPWPRHSNPAGIDCPGDCSELPERHLGDAR